MVLLLLAQPLGAFGFHQVKKQTKKVGFWCRRSAAHSNLNFGEKNCGEPAKCMHQTGNVLLVKRTINFDGSNYVDAFNQSVHSFLLINKYSSCAVSLPQSRRLLKVVSNK